MGDLITGGGINEGNGVYKSTDAGKTWKHLGLDDTKQIPSILVDPKDPNLVLLAAQGNIHTFTHMRGVYRSTDGGRNWKKTLYVDSTDRRAGDRLGVRPSECDARDDRAPLQRARRRPRRWWRRRAEAHRKDPPARTCSSRLTKARPGRRSAGTVSPRR